MLRDLQRVGVVEGDDARAAPTPAGGEPARAAAAPAVPTPVEISLKPHADLFRRAVDMRHVFAMLETLGPLTVETATDRLPPLRELDTQACALSFRLTLATEASPRRIAELLEMQFDADEFSIAGGAPEPPEAPRARQASPPPKAAAPAPRDPAPAAAPPRRPPLPRPRRLPSSRAPARRAPPVRSASTWSGSTG